MLLEIIGIFNIPYDLNQPFFSLGFVNFFSLGLVKIKCQKASQNLMIALDIERVGFVARRDFFLDFVFI